MATVVTKDYDRPLKKKTGSRKKNDLKLNLCAVGNKRAQRQFEYFIKPFSF